MASQGCVEVVKHELHCLQVGFDVLDGVGNVLDSINGFRYKLHTYKSCGSDASNRSSNTETVSHVEKSMGRSGKAKLRLLYLVPWRWLRIATSAKLSYLDRLRSLVRYHPTNCEPGAQSESRRALMPLE